MKTHYFATAIAAAIRVCRRTLNLAPGSYTIPPSRPTPSNRFTGATDYTQSVRLAENVIASLQPRAQMAIASADPLSPPISTLAASIVDHAQSSPQTPTAIRWQWTNAASGIGVSDRPTRRPRFRAPGRSTAIANRVPGAASKSPRREPRLISADSVRQATCRRSARSAPTRATAGRHQRT